VIVDNKKHSFTQELSGLKWGANYFVERNILSNLMLIVIIITIPGRASKKSLARVFRMNSTNKKPRSVQDEYRI